MKQSKLVCEIRSNLRTFSLMRQIQPSRIFVIGILSVLKALLPYTTIYFSARIITALETRMNAAAILYLVAQALICYSVPTILIYYYQRKKDVLNSLEMNAWSKLISDKLLALDYKDLEDPSVRNKFIQIRQTNQYNSGGYVRATRSIEGLLVAVIGVITAISLTIPLFTKKILSDSSYVFLNNPIFILLILSSLLIVIFVGPWFRTRSNEMMYGNMELARFSNRLLNHFQTFSMDRPESGMDIRIYQHQRIANKYSLQDRTWKPGGPFSKLTWGKAGFLDIIAELFSVISIVFIYLFVCLKALNGAFGIGQATQYIGAVTAMSGSLGEMFNEIGRLHNNTKYLDQLYEFLDLPNQMHKGWLTIEKNDDCPYEVEFKNVSFRYPNTDDWVLRNISLKISEGDRLAIVGANGSGKTTFIKLLCRLYDPTEGQILLNGIDIQQYDYQEYIKLFSVVFQDFQLLSFSLAQNVAASENYDSSRVSSSLQKVGFEDKLQEMPNGINTILFHDYEEDGVDISGGEAQKIAIARALYKDGTFIILDEPTASLDPIAEMEIYERFNETIEHRTAIYISHRLSSCRFSDRICVFDDGMIVQTGTHEELLKVEDGKYCELWKVQAKYYIS